MAGDNPPRKFTLREDKVRPKAEKVAWAMHRDSERKYVSRADPNPVPSLAGARLELLLKTISDRQHWFRLFGRGCQPMANNSQYNKKGGLAS